MLRKYLAFLGALCLAALLTYGGVRFYMRLTDGFNLANINVNLPYDPRWETRPLTVSEEGIIDQVLAQKFTYFAKGCQSYVFLSEDGRYVIKFFKQQHFRPTGWLAYATFFPGVEDYLERKIGEKQAKIDLLFTGCKLAFEEIPETTGVVYIHLNKSTGPAKFLTIYDKIGRQYELNLNELEFLIQKRSVMISEVLNRILEKKDIASGQELLSQVVSMVTYGCERGIIDKDPAIMQNTGVVGEVPILIDIGQLAPAPQVKDPVACKKEVIKKTGDLRMWLEKRSPELVSYLDNCIAALP